MSVLMSLQGNKYVLDELDYAANISSSKNTQRINYHYPLIVKGGFLYLNVDDLGQLFDLKIAVDISPTSSISVIATSPGYVGGEIFFGNYDSQRTLF